MVGLCCHMQAFSSCREGLLSGCCSSTSHCGSFSLLQNMGSRVPKFQCSWGNNACQPHNLWDFPGPGIEPMFPGLASRLLTTGPPGSPRLLVLVFDCSTCVCVFSFMCRLLWIGFWVVTVPPVSSLYI